MLLPALSWWQSATSQPGSLCPPWLKLNTAGAPALSPSPRSWWHGSIAPPCSRHPRTALGAYEGERLRRKAAGADASEFERLITLLLVGKSSNKAAKHRPLSHFKKVQPAWVKDKGQGIELRLTTWHASQLVTQHTQKTDHATHSETIGCEVDHAVFRAEVQASN
eukprot:scaffold80636_cov15-Tisochrysis_lutea.AAC.1